MPVSSNPWNSLELVKLLVATLTPLSVVLFGWFVSRRLKRLELVQWSNQKLIEKRLAVYDAVAPLLNKLLCFYTWVGYWKDISPSDVIKAKRDIDQTINIYRSLFEDEVYNAYQTYIHLLFETFTGAGLDAKIRSNLRGPDGDRTIHCSYAWDPAWAQCFSETNVVSKSEVRKRYYSLMQELRLSLGVHE
jgi:hypothetical protein